MNSRFLTSKIIQTEFGQNQLQAICNWLQTNQNINVTIKTIINRSNIFLINTENDSIKIKTIRDLKEKLAYANYDTQQIQYIVLLFAEKLTHSAQNALLKTIEEPPANTQIILITATPAKLLPTIQSRCQKISILTDPKKSQQELDPQLTTAVETLISENIAKKIELAQNYKDRDTALLFCNRLLLHLHASLKNTTDSDKKNKIRKLAQHLAVATQNLEKNTNVKLTLEVAFTASD